MGGREGATAPPQYFGDLIWQSTPKGSSPMQCPPYPTCVNSTQRFHQKKEKIVSGIGILFSETLPTAWCQGSPCRERPCLGHQSQGTLTSQISTENTRFTTGVFLILWPIFFAETPLLCPTAALPFLDRSTNMTQKTSRKCRNKLFHSGMVTIRYSSLIFLGSRKFCGSISVLTKKLGSLNYARSEP